MKDNHAAAREKVMANSFTSSYTSMLSRQLDQAKRVSRIEQLSAFARSSG